MILFATAATAANAVANQVEPFIHHRKLLREAQLRGADAQGCTFESCTGQPSTCPHQAALGFGSSRPSQGLQTHTLTFVNVATRAVRLSWLHGNGTASAFADIQAGQRTAVKTYTGDAWVAHSAATGELLMQHQVGPADIRSCAQCDDVAWQPLVTCPPRQPGKHNSSKRPDYEPASFFNAADEPVDIYLQGSGCEHLMTPNGSVAPGGQAHFAAWAGQRFTARRAEGTDRRVLLALHLGEILIRDCASPNHAHHPLLADATAGFDQGGGGGGSGSGVPNAGDLAKWTKSNLERIVRHLLAERQRNDERAQRTEARLAALEAKLAAMDAGGSKDAREARLRDEGDEPAWERFAVGAAGGMVRPIFDGDGGVGNGSFVEPVDAFYE